MGDGIAQGAIDATGIAAGLEGYAFARVAAPLATPAPRGYARASATKTRVPRDTKAFKSPVDARKGFDFFSNTLNTTWQSRRNASPCSRMADWSHLRTRTNRTNRTPSDCCGAGYTKREIALSTESLIADYALISSCVIIVLVISAFLFIPKTSRIFCSYPLFHIDDIL